MNEPSPALCPHCGARVPGEALSALCPRCLMGMNAAPDTEMNDEEPGPRGTRRIPAAAPAPEEALDSWIGRYRVREKLGEGGCGVVYVAEQEQPVRRRVALKVIKLGMDTRSVVARFEAERQALAMMDHPNIARVLDAGATDSGRPFFVMELVRGLRLTTYCDQNQLATEQRLKLFVQVCHAIQHAHQKGVIHRDIKPSNILVVEVDGVPVPKVIDFGIAKAVGEPLTDKPTYTGFQQFIGTPAYMSPEQAGLGGLDVDTRSDIYGLGVLLYELLTGRTPFQSKSAGRAAVDEVLRCIRDEEAPKPSTLLHRLEPREQTALSQLRATEMPRLIRSVRGDLDWIVLKCLEKNRARRYDTANDLARDIECHLNHQPVSAVAPTLRYWAMKWVRRHRRGFATAAAFALLVALGTTLSFWLARRAGEAEKEQARLRHVRWALETALPAVERSLERDDCAAAFKLIEQARPYVGENPRFQTLAAQAVGVVSLASTPAGAEVFLRDYSDLDPQWDPLGKSPLKQVKVPQGFKRWKIILPGYAPAEGTLFARFNPVAVEVKLDELKAIPPEMVRIRGEKHRAQLNRLEPKALPALNLSDFLLDRHEVTNRRYRQFVQAGGYRNPQYWKHKFFKDGTELSWAEAMRLFVDQTGRPGPATWENGDFPRGRDDYPVGGVSWYEAAAYAEFAGKRLPTVYHWSLAAGDSSQPDDGFLIPLSNFREKGPAPVGSLQGMTCCGIYDMAGNVKEWCFNETAENYRVIAGGGWNEPEYMFRMADKYPPVFRGANFGFRCMKPLPGDGAWEQAAALVQYRTDSGLRGAKPCSDEIFQAYSKLYDYSQTDLEAKLEFSEDISAYTRRERVSFNAPYGNQRMLAYLYLPRAGKPPFQTIIYFPGSSAWSLRSISAYGSPEVFESHTRHGRAFVFPVLQGTFERMPPPEQHAKATPMETRIMWVKDFRRTIDYLATRPADFDLGKLAYEGLSMGGIWGGIIPAVETRLKLVILFGGGLYLDFPEECSQLNFAPRIKVPILMLGGQYDFLFPVATHQRPLLELFGSPDADKLLWIYETGHAVWLKNEVRKDEREFLEKYFGPVR